MNALSQPWVMSRLLASGMAAILLVVALRVSSRLLKRWRITEAAEGQLAVERRAELVATLVQAALFSSTLALVVTLLGADRQSSTILGAMCAYGVFDASPLGFASLAVSAAAAVACALWLVLHRLDLAHEVPTLTRPKFLALFALAPIVWADLGLFARFVTDLDLSAHATCCSVSLGGADPASTWGASAGQGVLPSTWFAVALAMSLLAVVLFAIMRRRPSRGIAFLGGLASVGALASAVPAVLLYVAPHAYETPLHRCPFCLLHGPLAPLGWGLFAALLVGVCAGLGAALVGALQGVTKSEFALPLQRRLGAAAMLAWTCHAALVVYPVGRYVFVTGTTLL